MTHKKENFWIPYADLMTVLMVVFLFISIAYMGLLQLKQKEQDKLVTDYRQSKQELFEDLQKKFKDDLKRWNLELDKDLSIKFTNPQVLFASGKSEITPEFQKILSEFFPKYLSVVLKDKYREKIAEIRIEGHTDVYPIYNSNRDPYIDNIQLSQDRSRNVLAFIRALPSYKSLSHENESLLMFWLTANGLSYGRTLDSDKQLTHISGKKIDIDKSRRVEFRIVTTSDVLIDQMVDQIEKQ